MYNFSNLTTFAFSMMLSMCRSYIRSVGLKHDLAKSSLNVSIQRVVAALNDIAKNVIKWPAENLDVVKQKFQCLSNMPNVIGAIDGCNISIEAPKACLIICITSCSPLDAANVLKHSSSFFIKRKKKTLRSICSVKRTIASVIYVVYFSVSYFRNIHCIIRQEKKIMLWFFRQSVIQN